MFFGYSQEKIFLLNGNQFNEKNYNSFKDSLSVEGKITEEIVFSYNENGTTFIFPRLKIDNFKQNGSRFYFDENAYFEKTFKKNIDFSKLKEIRSNKNIDPSKPYFINCWYVNCSPCVAEIPDLNKLQKEYEGKVNFVAITFDDQNKVKKFLGKSSFNFIHLTNQKQLLDKMKISFYPMSFVLDKDGNFISFVSYQNDGSKKYTKSTLDRVINY